MALNLMMRVPRTVLPKFLQWILVCLSLLRREVVAASQLGRLLPFCLSIKMEDSRVSFVKQLVVPLHSHCALYKSLLVR